MGLGWDFARWRPVRLGIRLAAGGTIMRKQTMAAFGIGVGIRGGRRAAPFAQARAAQPDYHPSFGDLMTSAVQPRHIKLGIAGKARNWDYAAYEASELRNAFGRIGRTIPVYRKQALPDMFASAILPSM